MIVKCPSCNLNGNVSDSKIPSAGLSMKCPKCSNVFKIERSSAAVVGEDSEDRCSKCDTVKIDNISCAKCGLVFAKYQQRIVTETAEPETAEPETAESETAEPETAEPETAEPETAEPETAEPETPEPETPEPETPEPETPEPETPEPETPSHLKNVKLVSSINNASLIKISGVALLVALIVLAIFASRDWEYKVVTLTSGLSRTGSEAFEISTLVPSDESLNAYGKDGWELVSTHIERETAHPNYGNDDYVSGLQPNVRPQRLVMFLKRRVPFF
jgi:predicted Zn finger-like uncharacterized protein